MGNWLLIVQLQILSKILFLSAVLSVVYNFLWNSYISDQSSTSMESGMKMCCDQEFNFLLLARQAFILESICLFLGLCLFIFVVSEIQLPGAKLFVSYKQPSFQSSWGLRCCNFVVLAQYFIVAWACGDVMQWNYFVLFLEIANSITNCMFVRWILLLDLCHRFQNCLHLSLSLTQSYYVLPNFQPELCIIGFSSDTTFYLFLNIGKI